MWLHPERHFPTREHTEALGVVGSREVVARGGIRSRSLPGRHLVARVPGQIVDLLGRQAFDIIGFANTSAEDVAALSPSSVATQNPDAIWLPGNAEPVREQGDSTALSPTGAWPASFCAQTRF